MKPVKNAAKAARKREPLRRSRRLEIDVGPKLRFTPYAWAKLLFLRDYGDTEVGGFGVTSAEDFLLIADVQLVKQACSWAHVAFDDESVADFFDRQIDAGRRPEQFARHWLHTHPGDSPLPSATDEATFRSAFGRANWTCMFILAQEGETYARLRFNVGPGGDLEIPVEVDFQTNFAASDTTAWKKEYLNNVETDRTDSRFGRIERNLLTPPTIDDQRLGDEAWFDAWAEYVDPYSDQFSEPNVHE